MEETREKLQGNNKLDGGGEEFEGTRAEEIAFNRARAKESAARARSHKARSMAGYKTGTANDPKE